MVPATTITTTATTTVATPRNATPLLIFLLLLLLLPLATVQCSDDGGGAAPVVTCGSVVQLRHVSTESMLFSQQVQYGTGSRQQVVTTFPGKGISNAYWHIRGAIDRETRAPVGCPAGRPIRSGDTVRLQHVNTQGFLHSHLHRSPLTNGQEVSCFTQGSDSGDHWVVETVSGERWAQGAPVRLRHADTGKFLHVHPQARYGHPITGHYEVSGVDSQSADKNGLWMAEEGIYRETLE